MKYYYIHTNSYPVFEIDIVNRFGFTPPEIMLEAYGYFPVFPMPQKPALANDERLVEVLSPVIGSDGNYYENWVVEKIPEEDMQALLEEKKRVVRNERDLLLQSTDWILIRHQEEKTRGAATTLSDEELGHILKKRQALRDITSLPEFPHVDLSSYK